MGAIREVWGLVLMPLAVPVLQDISRMVGPGTVEAQARKMGPIFSLAFNYPSSITASNPCNKPTPGGPYPPNKLSQVCQEDLLWATHMRKEERCTGASPQSTLEETEQPSPSPMILCPSASGVDHSPSFTPPGPLSHLWNLLHWWLPGESTSALLPPLFPTP